LVRFRTQAVGSVTDPGVRHLSVAMKKYPLVAKWRYPLVAR
jgi:hypothetical protein